MPPIVQGGSGGSPAALSAPRLARLLKRSAPAGVDRLRSDEARLAALTGTTPSIAPTRGRAILTLVAVFTFFLSAYVLTAAADLYGTGDTSIRIQVAQNFTGRLSLNLFGWKLIYPHHLKKEYYDPRIAIGRGGRTYSTYLPGQPLMLMPLDIAASRLATQERWPYGPAVYWFDRLVGPISGAIEMLIFFAFAVRLGYGRRGSLVLTLIFGFATMAWPDEQSVNEHTIVAFSLLAGWYAAFRAREQGAPEWYYILAGAGIGGAFITRYQDAAVAMVGLWTYLLWRRNGGPPLVRRAIHCVGTGLGLAPFVAIILWYNWVRFGSIAATGHHENTFGYAIWLGASGLLFSPGKGLIWYTPTIFLLIFAGPRFYRRLPGMVWGIAAMAVAMFTLYGYVTFWHGDPTWGPRYVYPLVPFLTLPLGELLPSLRRINLVSLVSGLVLGISLVIQVSAVSVSPWRTWYRVIAYEESKGYTWQWIASRYRYFWIPQESPLYFQIHGLYQLVYDSALGSRKYEIVPPDEDAVLDRLSTDYSLNSWNFWWKADEFSWWMGRQKVVAMVTILAALALASGTYLAAESSGLFDEDAQRGSSQSLEDAA